MKRKPIKRREPELPANVTDNRPKTAEDVQPQVLVYANSDPAFIPFWKQSAYRHVVGGHKKEEK